MFTRDDNANASGTSLYETLDGVTTDQLRAAFGEPSYSDSEMDKGYRHEYRFRAADGGVCTLYDRWGTWRVGTGPRHGDDFTAWVLAAVRTGRAPMTPVAACELALRILARDGIRPLEGLAYTQTEREQIEWAVKSAGGSLPE